MSREIILEAMNGIRDEYITEVGAKLGLVAVGAAGAVGAASGAAVDPSTLYSLSHTETAAKAGFGAWLAKGGWIALAAGVLVVAGVAVGAFFFGKSGDTPPVGSGDVTSFETEESTTTDAMTDEGERETESKPETDSESESETAAESGSDTESESETETETKPDPESCAHTFGNWQFAAVPTCTETGVRTRECSLCGKTEDEDMPAGLHTFDGRACSVCGESMTGMEFTSYGDGTCCVKDAGRVRGDMVIPNYSPEGDLVIAIGKNAFSGSFDSLVWPEKLTSIGEMAFSECNLPEGFALPDGLTSIGKSAFAYCRRITKIHIPASVTEIGQNAFEGVTTLTEITFGEGIQLSTIPACFAVNTSLASITLPDSVTTIGSTAFAHTALKELRLPYSVTKIESMAFAGCTQLAAVQNTAGLTHIGPEAFTECSSLSELSLSDGLTHIGYHAFRGCSSLSYTEYDGGYYLAIGENPYAILAFGRKDVTTAGLHKDVCIAVGGAFEDNTQLTSFTFSDTITRIPDRFFYGCTSLRAVHLPDTVTTVGAYAFYQCSALTDLPLRVGMTTIEEYAFGLCHGLTAICLPEGITNVGAYAFTGCNNLLSAELPTGMTRIAEGLFLKCPLLNSVILPEGITHIGHLAFSWMDRNNATSLDIRIPKSVSYLGEQCFANSSVNARFDGTKAEWEAIEKGDGCFGGIGSSGISCTDGILFLNK